MPISTLTANFSVARVPCYYRPLILAVVGLVLVSLFWFASRYPQLFQKAEHVGQAVSSMAYSSEVLHVASDAPVWQRILVGTVNWLSSMKSG